MENLDLIIEKYKHMSTDELVDLAKNPGELERSVIPHLQSELLSRDKKEAALSLSNFLIALPTAPVNLKGLTKAELFELIKLRIDSGENIEGIKLDLLDNGYNMLDIMNDDQELKNQSLEYLTSLKTEGLSEEQIDEKMKNTFSITENETEILKQQLKLKGKQNLIIGYSMLFIIGLLGLSSLSMGGSVGFGFLIIMGTGVWLVALGYKQRK